MIELAIQAISRNALCSFLTVFGIVIGVAAGIAMVTCGQGSTQQVTADVEKLGSDVVMILPGQDAMQGGPGDTGASSFTLRDNDTVEGQLSIVEISAPHLSPGGSAGLARRGSAPTVMDEWFLNLVGSTFITSPQQ